MAVEFLDPLGRGGKPSNIPCRICWLNLVVLVEREDHYSAVARKPDFEGRVRSGGSLSPSNPGASRARKNCITQHENTLYYTVQYTIRYFTLYR